MASASLAACSVRDFLTSSGMATPGGGTGRTEAGMLSAGPSARAAEARKRGRRRVRGDMLGLRMPRRRWRCKTGDIRGGVRCGGEVITMFW
jgi:hypothetical protein